MIQRRQAALQEYTKLQQTQQKQYDNRTNTVLQQQIDSYLGIGRAAKSAESSAEDFRKASIASAQASAQATKEAAEQQEKLASTYWNGRFSEQIDSLTKGSQNAELARMREYYQDAAKAADELYKVQQKTASDYWNGRFSEQIKQLGGESKNSELARMREYYENLEKESRQLQEEAERSVDEMAQQYQRVIVNGLQKFATQLITNQWKEALQYSTQYYDSLNEIRTVTLKSEQDASKMGQNFRELAKEMKVSSTEIASAAVTFYRQGLGDQDVQKRLEWVTKYAKIANIDFENAAQIVTSATNSMAEDIQGDVQRVVDVFLYLGDAAATSGEEIGTAMQKASASATEFGLSFEWLGAYIATVSEQTRQAPQTIGNAFNTMLARLHTIRATGYNSEDETKINDVAKALKTIDVELMDQQGNWRDMSDIFTDVSEKWGTMTDKQKSYLATTMAGVRQQNVFFALMNDLGKGIENGSRAWELYTGAINASGTATEKYSVWADSVAAAQGNMKASLEGIYASLNVDLLKGFYNVIAGLADGISKIGGVIPLVGGLLVGSLVPALITAAKTAAIGTTAMGVFAAALQKVGLTLVGNPIIMAAAGALAVFVGGGIMGGLVDSLHPQTTQEKYEAASKQMDEIQQKIDSLKKLQGDFNKSFASVGDGANKSASDLANYNAALDRVAQVSPRAQQAIKDFNDGIIDHATTIGIVNEELEKMIELEQNQQVVAAAQKLSNLTVSPDIKEKKATDTTILDYLGFDIGDYDSRDMDANVELFERLMKVQEEYLSFKKLFDDQGMHFNETFLPNGQLKEAYKLLSQAAQMAGVDLSDQDAVQKNAGLITNFFWNLLFGDDYNSEAYQASLEQEMARWTDATMEAIGSMEDMSFTDKALLRPLIEQLIMGDDGLQRSDFSDETREALVQFRNDIVNGAIDLLDTANSQAIFEALFGPGNFDEFEDVFIEDLQSFFNDINTLIESGISTSDIKTILQKS